MHTSSMLRMQWFVKEYLPTLFNNSSTIKLSVLDVGSYNVNGCYKPLFDSDQFTYTGLDISAGPNVDIVAEKTYWWPMLNDESFDLVISGQAFEHMEFFWFAIAEMVRKLKRGGLLCIIAPRGFERHRYPVDTYRFDADGMIAMAKYANLKPLHASMNLAPPGATSKAWYSTNGKEDSMLIAQKPLDWSGFVDPRTYNFIQNDLNALATGFITMGQQIKLGYWLSYKTIFWKIYLKFDQLQKIMPKILKKILFLEERKKCKK